MTSADTESATAPPAAFPAAVLWDMDGTLVDTEPYWFASERDLVDEFGHGHWPDEHAHAMVGFDLRDSAAYMQKHGGVDLPTDDIVERLLDGVIARLHRRIPWRPGARELLAEVNAAGIPCALVTMSWRRFVDPVMAALPAESFVATITGDEVPLGEGKPSPTPYLLGAEACGVDPRDCLAVEDSPTGVRSAVSAGCTVLGIPNVKELHSEPGVILVESLEQIDVSQLGRLAELADAELAPSNRSLTIDRTRLLIGVAIVVSLLAGFWFVTRGSDEPAPTPLPPGAVPVDAWAPFWTLDVTLTTSEERMGDLREVSPFWYAARGADEIAIDENVNEERADEFIARIADSPARFVPSIIDELPAGGMADILDDPTTRRQHIDAILTFADGLDADGIDLDYEQFAFADDRTSWPDTRGNWVAFVTELAEELHAVDRTLTVSIPPVWGLTADELMTAAEGSLPVGQPDGFWVYDHAAIAEHVDAIRIMAYDYSVAEVGPIAPIWWVDDLVETLTAVVPAEHHDKLVLGIGAYGRNWVTSTLGDCPASAEGRTNVFALSVLDLAERRGGTPVYDPVTAEWSFQYALSVEAGDVSCVQNREVRWVDAEGAAARTEVARRAGWGGVSLWALGYEDAEVWTTMLDASRRDLAPATDGA